MSTKESYLFYVRKYSIISNSYEWYVYRCYTDDPYHTMGEMMYRGLEHIKRIDFVKCTDEKLKFWEKENQEILIWTDKYKRKVNTNI